MFTHTACLNSTLAGTPPHTRSHTKTFHRRTTSLTAASFPVPDKNTLSPNTGLMSSVPPPGSVSSLVHGQEEQRWGPVGPLGHIQGQFDNDGSATSQRKVPPGTNEALFCRIPALDQSTELLGSSSSSRCTEPLQLQCMRLLLSWTLNQSETSQQGRAWSISELSESAAPANRWS